MSPRQLSTAFWMMLPWVQRGRRHAWMTAAAQHRPMRTPRPAGLWLLHGLQRIWIAGTELWVAMSASALVVAVLVRLSEKRPAVPSGCSGGEKLGVVVRMAVGSVGGPACSA